MYPKTKTRRELRETVRWKGKERPLIVEILNGNLVVTVKGVRAPHLPLRIGGRYLAALAADAGVPAPPPNTKGRRLPRASELTGSDPNFTGDVSTDKYIRDMREGSN